MTGGSVIKGESSRQTIKRSNGGTWYKIKYRESPITKKN